LGEGRRGTTRLKNWVKRGGERKSMPRMRKGKKKGGGGRKGTYGGEKET